MPASRGFMLYVSAAAVGLLGLGQPGPAEATGAASVVPSAVSSAASSSVTTAAAAAAAAATMAAGEAAAMAAAGALSDAAAAAALSASSLSILSSETHSVVSSITVAPSHAAPVSSPSSSPSSSSSLSSSPLPTSSSSSSASLSSSLSVDNGTCQYKTINYLTHTLPQQCLWTSWTAANATAAPANMDPTRAGAGVPGGAPASPTAFAAAAETGASSSSVAAGGGDDDGQDDLATNSFMSFEEWKVLQLKKAGQDPADIQARRRQQQQQQQHQHQHQQQRQRQHINAGGDSSLDSIGDDGEIALDFDVLQEKVSELASRQQQQYDGGGGGGGGGTTYHEADGGPDGSGGGGGKDNAGSGGKDNAGSSGGAGAAGDRPTQEDALLYADGGAQYYRSKDAGKTSKARFSFASFDAGATVLKTNKGAKNAKAILVENKDSYMLMECGTRDKYVVVELSDDILVDTVVLANFEFFSSMVRRFRVSVSDRYPAKADRWKTLGEFEARNARDIQPFLIEHPQIWAKYLRIDFLTHYGNEYYCPLSLLRVHGTRMLDSWKDSENGHEDEDDGEDDDDEDEGRRRNKAEQRHQQEQQRQAAAEAEAEAEQQRRQQDQQRQSDRVEEEQQQQQQQQQQQEEYRKEQQRAAEERAAVAGDTAQPTDAASNSSSPWDPLAWYSSILFPAEDAQCSASSAPSSVGAKPAAAQTPASASGNEGAANGGPGAAATAPDAAESPPLASTMSPGSMATAVGLAELTDGTQSPQPQQPQPPSQSKKPNPADAAAVSAAFSSSASASASPSRAAAASPSSAASSPEPHAPPPASGSSVGSLGADSAPPRNSNSSSSIRVAPSGASAAGSAHAAASASGSQSVGAKGSTTSSSPSPSPPSPSSSHSPSPSSPSAAPSAPPPPPPPPPPPAMSPPVQESFFKSITKRLTLLESNTSLSLQYIEDQSRFLQEALRKMERKQSGRVDAFLDSLNQTVLAELRHMRQQYDQIWQSTVLALETQREQSQRETVALSDRLNVLADEVVFQKRMAILQSVLLLCCLALVIFSRGLLTPTASAGGGHGGGGGTAGRHPAHGREAYFSPSAPSPPSMASSPDYERQYPAELLPSLPPRTLDMDKLLPLTPTTPTTPTSPTSPTSPASPTAPAEPSAAPPAAFVHAPGLAESLQPPTLPRLDEILEADEEDVDFCGQGKHQAVEGSENALGDGLVTGLGLPSSALASRQQAMPTLTEDHSS